MSEQIPPLPELEVLSSTRRHINQQDLDRVLHIVCEHHPEFFTLFAEKEKQNLGVEDYAGAFYNFVSTEVWKHVPKPENIGFAAGKILLEARRRARLMYGLPLDKGEYVPNPRVGGNAEM